MKRSIAIAIGVVVALLLAGGAFWQGMNVGKAQAQSDQSAFLASRGFGQNGGTGGTGGTGTNGGTGNGGNGGFAGGFGRGGQNGATGTIQSISGNTITLTTNQGDTMTVQFAQDTPVLKSVVGTVSDLKPGMRIVAVGTRSGNNVSATNIQIADRPAGFGNPFGRATPTPSSK